MSKQIKILTAAILGTSAMTAFSYLFSHFSKNNTREPELLGKMIHRLKAATSRSDGRTEGWIAHYSVGVLFAELYAQIWERTACKASARSGLVFGGLSGIAAILVWKFVLAMHPFPPALDFKGFALNLFLAHLVFGFFAGVIYHSPVRRNSDP